MSKFERCYCTCFASFLLIIIVSDTIKNFLLIKNAVAAACAHFYPKTLSKCFKFNALTWLKKLKAQLSSTELNSITFLTFLHFNFPHFPASKKDTSRNDINKVLEADVTTLKKYFSVAKKKFFLSYKFL